MGLDNDFFGHDTQSTARNLKIKWDSIKLRLCTDLKTITN